MRYGEHQSLAADADSSGRPQIPAAQTSGSSKSDDNYGFSVVRKSQLLKVVGIIDEEPYGGMRTVSRGRIFLPVDLRS